MGKIWNTFSLFLVLCALVFLGVRAEEETEEVADLACKGFSFLTGDYVEDRNEYLLADYFKFSYLGAEIPAEIGRAFLTILNAQQRQQIWTLAGDMKPEIEEYWSSRGQLRQLFYKSLIEGAALDAKTIGNMNFLVYHHEGTIGLTKAKAFRSIYRSLTEDQKAELQALRASPQNPRIDPLNEIFPGGKDEDGLIENISEEGFAWLTGGAPNFDAFSVVYKHRLSSYFGLNKLKEENPSLTINQICATVSLSYIQVLPPFTEGILERALRVKAPLIKDFLDTYELLIVDVYSILNAESFDVELIEGVVYEYHDLVSGLDTKIALLETSTYISLGCSLNAKGFECLQQVRENINSPRCVYELTAKSQPPRSVQISEPDQELGFAEDRVSKDGVLDTVLNFDVHYYDGPIASFVTRGYDNSIPGPTMRVRRGDVMKIKLNNNLGPHSTNDPVSHNTYNYPNRTNLHTHGLHVSGDGIADNVLLSIEPGDSFDYVIEIPSDHAGGTFWYHPHRHGSTFLQVAQVASGMIIVEDEPGDVPDTIFNMVDVPLMIQHVKLTGVNNVQTIAQASTPPDELWSQNLKGYVAGTNDSAYNFVLVNGQYHPKYTMTLSQWYRFRLAFGGHSQYLYLHVNDTACEMKLLAKDGIYVADAPRPITYVLIPPGGRADVAIRCNAVGSFFLRSIGTIQADTITAELVTQVLRLDVTSPSLSPDAMKPSKYRTLSTIQPCQASAVSTLVDSELPPLDPFSAFRPQYLWDLRSLTPDDIGGRFSLSVTGGTINGIPFSPPPDYQANITIGQVHEWTLTGVGVHPLHVHINPMQIISGADDGDYYKIGDFHDTLRVLSSITNTANVRFQADRFAGNMVFHCHILPHEDLGMMGIAYINGEEGTVWVPPSSYEPPSKSDPSDNDNNKPGEDPSTVNPLSHKVFSLTVALSVCVVSVSLVAIFFGVKKAYPYLVGAKEGYSKVDSPGYQL